MIVYKDYISFSILQDEVILICSDTAYGRNTVAEINDQRYYLGDEQPTLGAACLAWQAIKGRDLSDNEMHKILADNSLISK